MSSLSPSRSPTDSMNTLLVSAAMGPLQAVLEKHAGREAVDRVVQNGLTALALKSRQDPRSLHDKAYTSNRNDASTQPSIPRPSSQLQLSSDNNGHKRPSSVDHGRSNSGPSFAMPPPLKAPNRTSPVASGKRPHGQAYIRHNDNPHRYGGVLPSLGPMDIPPQFGYGQPPVYTRPSTPDMRPGTSMPSQPGIPTSSSTSPSTLPPVPNHPSPRLNPKPYQPQPPRRYQPPPPPTPQQKYETELKAYTAHKAEEAAELAASEDRRVRQRTELLSDPDVLLHRYREYNSVFPLASGESVNTYYTKLLANSTITAADVGTEKEKIVEYAKRNYFNLYRAAGGRNRDGKRDMGDVELVRELVREEERVAALGAGEVRKDRLKRKRGVEVRF